MTAVHDSPEHIDEPIPSATDVVPHVARCRTCDVGAKYYLTVSGAGLVVLDLYGLAVDTPLGIGEGGAPVCPNGHGEMELADDTLPAGEAFEMVRKQLQGGDLEPLQGTLPGIVPPFNYQGAYLELEAMAVECDRLRIDHEDKAGEAKKAKKRLDEASELYTKAAIEFRRRRREKVETGSPIADLDGDRCTFEQLHPDQLCPICKPQDPSAEMAGFAPPTAAAHVQEAEDWLVKRSVQEVVDAIHAQAMVVSTETVLGWSPEERAGIIAWSTAIVEGTEPRPERPEILGKMHVAGVAIIDEPQTCTQCDAVLSEADGPSLRYEAGTLVGVDCKGKPKEAARQIKSSHTKKASGKKR